VVAHGANRGGYDRRVSALPTVPDDPPTGPGRRGVLKLILLLASTGIALIALEAGLRVSHPFGFRQRGSTLVLPKNTVYDIRADARSRSDQLEAHVVHTKNSLGFRGPEPPADFPSWLTIVAIGGSTTECFYLADGKTWPERFAARLHGEARNVWVDNAGLDGHSSFGHLLLTRQAIVPLHPKVTLYLLGLNDMFTDAPHDLDEVEVDPVGMLADHSELVATLLNLWRWKKTRALEDLGSMPKPVALRDRPRYEMPAAEAERLWREQEPRLAGFRRRLVELVELNREHRIEPVLVTQPTLLGGVDARTGLDTRAMDVEVWQHVDGAFAWRLLERYNDVTRQVGRDHHVLVVDLARRLDKDSTYFYDFFHFTNAGADRVGALVHDDVRPWLMARYPGFAVRPGG
jgi:lysophospholipase L1-like esterase